MTTRTKKLATLLAVAVVLTSGAYALGSAGRRRRRAGLELRVRERVRQHRRRRIDRLDERRPRPRRPRRPVPVRVRRPRAEARREHHRAAERPEGHPRREDPDQRKTERSQALAAALGKPVDDVTERGQLRAPRPPGRPGKAGDHRGDFAAALAKAARCRPGEGPGRPRQGPPGPRQGPPRRNGGRRFDRGAFENTVVNDIASATGVDAAKVRSALQGLRPKAGDHWPRPRRRARRHPPEARDRPRRDDRAARRRVPEGRHAGARPVRDRARAEAQHRRRRRSRTPFRTCAAASPSDSGIAMDRRRVGLLALSRSSSSSTTRRPSGRPSSARCASRASPCRRPPAGARRSRRSRRARRPSSSST